MGRLRDATLAVRKERPVISAVLLFGLWCEIAPTAHPPRGLSSPASLLNQADPKTCSTS